MSLEHKLLGAGYGGALHPLTGGLSTLQPTSSTPFKSDAISTATSTQTFEDDNILPIAEATPTLPIPESDSCIRTYFFTNLSPISTIYAATITKYQVVDCSNCGLTMLAEGPFSATHTTTITVSDTLTKTTYRCATGTDPITTGFALDLTDKPDHPIQKYPVNNAAPIERIAKPTSNGFLHLSDINSIAGRGEQDPIQTHPTDKPVVPKLLLATSTDGFFRDYTTTETTGITKFTGKGDSKPYNLIAGRTPIHPSEPSPTTTTWSPSGGPPRPPLAPFGAPVILG